MSSALPVVLIVDTDKTHAQRLADSLQGQCGKMYCADDLEIAVKTLCENHIDIAIADADVIGNASAADLLGRLKDASPMTCCIITTSNPTITQCKDVIRQGAFDYIEKPIDANYLTQVIQDSQDLGHVQSAGTKSSFTFDGVVGQSQAMQSVFHVLQKVAPTNISVLIEGQSGTGKELFARAIHQNSQRSSMPFCPINCAGLTESLLESELFGHAKGAFTGAAADRKGLFQIADKGTLFLDEIGDMPLNMQAKLLRVLEDGIVIPVGSNKPVKVDVRVVGATNHDLAKLVDEKKFRQDLYFRIKGVSITLPPLQSRPRDIPELFGYFLKQACQEVGRDIHRITERAMAVLVTYDWPGNIRQLCHVIRTMVVMCDGDTIDVQDIPPEINRLRRISGQVAGQGDYKATGKVIDTEDASTEFIAKSLSEVEKAHIAKTLSYTQGNRSEAAKILEIGERTLYRKIKEYGL